MEQTQVESSKPVRKAIRKGRGKDDQAEKQQWISVIEDAIKNNPCGTILKEDKDGHPIVEARAVNKRIAWVIEVLGKDDQTWEYNTYLNLDKSGSSMKFTHAVKWCMEKLKAEHEYFEKGTFDKCKTRLRNLQDNSIIMAAVLI